MLYFVFMLAAKVQLFELLNSHFPLALVEIKDLILYTYFEI